MTFVSVLIPTVTGREDWLARTIEEYERHTPDVQILTLKDTVGSWGEAINLLAEQAAGDYLHLTADDCYPTGPGWLEAAAEKADAGQIPAPRVLWPDGRLQSCGDWEREAADGEATEFSRFPFLTQAQWHHVRPVIPVTFYADNWVSRQARGAGFHTAVARGYELVHHMVPEARGDYEKRFAADRAVYEAYCDGRKTL